ncbi:MAG: hypothetical protein MUC89_00895 [Acetobacteraceae bacterium]|jgi:hypothetical protein|nr:hypothetical protein [Acetobacteraceae bacterium]
MRLAIAGTCAALLLAAPAAAQQRLNSDSFNVRTTGDLIRLCATPGDDPQYLEALGWCHGYGRGALDYHRAAAPANAAPLFCAPNPSPSWEEVRRRFIAWGNANAQVAGSPAVEGVFRFLLDTFPCPRR